MSDCSSREVGAIVGRGSSKKNFKRSYKKAMRDFESEGRSKCIGGLCATGSCTFRTTSTTVSYRTHIPEPGGPVYYDVEIQGTGECYCPG